MKYMSKIYIRDKKEIFEFSENLVSDDNSIKPVVVDRVEQDLGDALSDFVSLDLKKSLSLMRSTESYFISLEKKKETERFETAVKELKNIAEYFEDYKKSHIFFYPVSNYIRRVIIESNNNERLGYIPKFLLNFAEKAGKNSTKYLTCISGDLEDFIPNIVNFFKICLDIDIKTNLSPEQKYLKFLNQEKNFYKFGVDILRIWGFLHDVSSTVELMPTYDFDLEKIKNKISQKNLTEVEIKETPMTFTEIFTPKDIFEYPKDMFEVVHFFCWYFLKNDIKFRKCKNCGKYFCLTGNLNTDYCNRLAKNSNKTCKEVGAARKYKEKLLQNPVNQLFNKAYKKYSARVRYKSIDKTQFEWWSKIAREQRDKCLKGALSYEEFEDFLENFENVYKEEFYAK